MQPEEDSSFGGIAQDTGLFAREVERGCAVHRHSFGDEATFVRVVQSLRSKAIELCFADTHLILGQCACFIGANDRRSTHRFAGVHFTHKIVALEHATHGISKA